jgi:hypothetical protein
VSHLLRHFGIELPARPRPPAPPPPPPKPEKVMVSKSLLLRFKRYRQAHGGWGGLRFDGLECEPTDSEGALLASILRSAHQETRWKIRNRAERLVG